MSDIFLRRTLSVEVLTPVHIGSGEVLTNKFFMASPEVVSVLDERKMLDWAMEEARRGEAFIRFMEQQTIPAQEFFTQQRLPLTHFLAYQLPNLTKGRLNNVRVFAKTPSQHPYLPGSSFKGGLRSALLRGLVLLKSNEISEHIREAAVEEVADRRKLPGQGAERAAFVPKGGLKRGQESNYTWMRILNIGDSSPVERRHLQVREVRVLSSVQAGAGRALGYKTTPSGREMQIFAEMLMPDAETRLRLPLSMQLGLLLNEQARQELEFEGLERRITEFTRFCHAAARNLLAQELTFYQTHGHAELVAQMERLQTIAKACEPPRTFMFPVGWGTGFDAKTITDRLGQEAFSEVVSLSSPYKMAQGVGRPGRRGPWLGPSLAPKSRKVVLHPDGSHLPIGWLKVEVTK